LRLFHLGSAPYIRSLSSLSIMPFTEVLMRSVARVALCLSLIAVPSLATSQHAWSEQGAPYDPKVPTPWSILGYDFGLRHASRDAALHRATRRGLDADQGDTVARSFEGREMLLITVSEANMARLDQHLADARRIADPRGAAAGEVDAAIGRLPAIVWLAHSVHGGEASGVEAGSRSLPARGGNGRRNASRARQHDRADRSQPEPGWPGAPHARRRARMECAEPPYHPGAINNSGSWPGPHTSHYSFDLNRDWFIMSHPESRGRVAAFLKWMPHVAVDLHEQGSSASFYFAPPREPDNKNNPEHLFKWYDIFAAAHGAEFDKHGWSYFRREGYDSFYPGYGEGWPMLTGSIGMLFESASSSGGAIQRNDGAIRTLRQAAWEHYTAEWATVRTSARRRTELLADYAKSRRDAIRLHAAGPMRAIVIERDGQGRADSLVVKLRANGIDVLRLGTEVDLRDATPFGERSPGATTRVRAGAFVVDLAQPQGHLAKALLEPDAELDSAFIRTELEMRRTGQPDRFYDITAWSMPYAYRVKAWHTRSVPAAAAPFNSLLRDATPPAPRAPYGYVFEPGSESSIRLLASLLKDSVRVWHAPRSFSTGGRAFPHGAFLVRVAPNAPSIHDVISAHATNAGAAVYPVASAGVDQGTDLGSNSVRPIRFPRVALLATAPVNGNAFGFSWFALDQRIGYPATLVDASFISSPGMSEFNVLVMPSLQGGALDRVLGESGRSALGDWVRNGGVLITIDGATTWLAQESTKLARIRVRRDSTRADSAGGAPLPANLPGVIARATIDTLSPLLAGVNEAEIPVFANSDRVLTVPKDLRAGEAIVRFAPQARVRLAGYFWPEMPERVALSPWLWTERVGRGRVIAFAHDLNFRDLFRGLLPIFGNSVLLGGTF
jgi:hypothetical protein